MLGVDLLNEDHVDKMLGPKKKKKTNEEKLEEALGDKDGDVGDAKIEDLEAPPAWEADPNDPPQSPVDISSRFAVVAVCRSSFPCPLGACVLNVSMIVAQG